jgi:hypothetical protein
VAQSATPTSRGVTTRIGDVAVDMPPAPAPGKIQRGFVVDAHTVADQGQFDDLALAPAGRSTAAGPSELLISVNLPGRDTQIGISLRPSRVAAAWVAWLVLTLLVMAFWLPMPRLRRRTALLGLEAPSPTGSGRSAGADRSGVVRHSTGADRATDVDGSLG